MADTIQQRTVRGVGQITAKLTQKSFYVANTFTGDNCCNGLYLLETREKLGK